MKKPPLIIVAQPPEATAPHSYCGCKVRRVNDQS